MPQVRFWFLNLGLGCSDAQWVETLFWQKSPALHHVQLLPAAAAVADNADTRHFCAGVGKGSGKMEFRLIGYVVMPEHVRLLMSEPKHGTPSGVLHRLKLGSSRTIRGHAKNQAILQVRLFGKATVPPLRAIWQPRFYDFNVYSHGEKIEKLNYMHANPVIRGLVEHPKDWPWSSWSFYMKQGTGLIRIDSQ